VFLDALAEPRRAQGLPALSIAWGPWAKVGLAAGHANRGARLARAGLASISPEQGKTLLSPLILQPGAQVLVMPFDVDAWRQHDPSAGEHSLFAGLQSAQPSSGSPGEAAGKPVGILVALQSEPAGKQRRALLEAELRGQAAQVLRIPAAKIPPHKPLKNFGLDSLMALEFSNRLEACFEIKVPVSTIWNYPTIQDLAEFMAAGLGITLVEETPEAPAAPVGELAVEGPAPVPSEMDDLSKAELEALLAEEISQANKLLQGGVGE
jgi:acyl carrier protein